MSQSNAIDPSCAECVAAADIDVSTQTSNSHQHRHEQQLQVPEDIMDPSTFRPMSLDQGPAIFIEYCDRVSGVNLLIFSVDLGESSLTSGDVFISFVFRLFLFPKCYVGGNI